MPNAKGYDARWNGQNSKFSTARDSQVEKFASVSWAGEFWKIAIPWLEN